MKFLSGFLALFLCAALPLYAAGLDDLTWTTTDGEVTITGCVSSATGELIIPDTIGGNPVISIGYQAFRECTSLTNITIPDSVTSIGVNAFFNCTSLTGITISDSVTSIGTSAFGGCESLTGIAIPDSISSIGDHPFMRCSSLTSIEVGVGNLNYTDVNGVLFNKEKTVLHTYSAGKTDANYTVPDSVRGIGSNAFYKCNNLTSIKFGENSQLGSIGLSAFSNCKSLAAIILPNSVTSIGESAFGGCESLTDITIPDSVKSIGNQAFSN